MFKKVVVGLFACFMVFLGFSCDSDCGEDSVQYSQDFEVDVFSRSEQIFVSWGVVEKSDGYEKFKKIKIECKSEDKTVSSKEIEDTEKTFQHIFGNLENNRTYSVVFTGETESGAYRKTVDVVPQKLQANAERVMAFMQNGKTYINFTLDEFLDSDEKENPFTGVNVYNIEERLSDYECSLVPFYEVISGDVPEDSTKTYSKYYSVVVDDGEYSSVNLRLIGKNDVETESISVETKKLSLPVVSVEYEYSDSNLEKFTNKKKIDASLSTLNYSGTNILNADLTVKGRGNSSWTNAPKKSYTLKFNEKQDFLGLGKNKSFALVANYFDKSLLRNISAYELAKNVFKNMMWASGVEPVNLFVNNIYCGVYNATETIKISSSRVGVPDVSDCSDAADFENYGFILEIDSRMEENLNWYSPKNVPFNLKEPDGEDLPEEIQNLIKEKVNSVEEKLFSDGFDDSSSENYYENYLDTDSFVDWWLLEELAKNTDSNFFSSCYMVYNPADKKFYMGPVWDFDLGFGNTNDYSADKIYSGFKAEEKSEGQESENWILRLLGDTAFKEKAKTRWNELKPQITAYFEDEFEQNYEKIEKDSGANFSRYEILGESVWKSPNDCETRTTYLSEKEYLKDWVSKRIEWLDSAL